MVKRSCFDQPKRNILILISSEMSIPAVDVKLLRKLHSHIVASKMNQYIPGRSRSAVALIFRLADDDHQTVMNLVTEKRNLTAEAALRILEAHMDPFAHSSLQILVVKKSNLSEGRWSGQVSFPGGLRDPDDADDMATVHRETYDGLGIPINTPDFVYFGRLRDVVAPSRRLFGEGQVQARFVFMHIGAVTPSVKLARHEIEAVRWCPVSVFQDPDNLMHRGVSYQLQEFLCLHDNEIRDAVDGWMSCSRLYFPAIRLKETNWKVWGLSLRSISEILEVDGRDPVDWPLVSSDNQVFQHFVINAYHGYLEIFKQARPSAKPEHVFWLIADACIVFLFLLAVLSIYHELTFAVLWSLDVVDADEHSESSMNLKEYIERFGNPLVIQSLIPRLHPGASSVC
jgi:8-oxo-dGTP pyrophosphatase MutT (NUDIX family)